jgi:hypothetical protein
MTNETNDPKIMTHKRTTTEMIARWLNNIDESPADAILVGASTFIGSMWAAVSTFITVTTIGGASFGLVAAIPASILISLITAWVLARNPMDPIPGEYIPVLALVGPPLIVLVMGYRGVVAVIGFITEPNRADRED